MCLKSKDQNSHGYVVLNPGTFCNEDGVDSCNLLLHYRKMLDVSASGLEPKLLEPG